MMRYVILVVALLVPLHLNATVPSLFPLQQVPSGGGGGGSCGTISGDAATDAAAAGFDTCAFFNDFTQPIPNTIGTGLPANWLNCTGSDTGAVWNITGTTPTHCPADYRQVQDPAYPNKALNLHFQSSYLTNDGHTKNTDWLSTMPADWNSSNPNVHTFSAGYFEWTYREAQDSPNFNGNMQLFWSWHVDNNAFTDAEFMEDWSTGGTGLDYGWNQWDSSGNDLTGAGFFFSSGTNTVYHTVGMLLTGNATSYSYCSYLDGVRQSCNGNNYVLPAEMNIGQRRQLYLWNGTDCGYDLTNISCVPPNFGNEDLYIKSFKVLTCAAEPSGGSCINNTFNGNFYTP